MASKYILGPGTVTLVYRCLRSVVTYKLFLKKHSVYACFVMTGMGVRRLTNQGMGNEVSLKIKNR